MATPIGERLKQRRKEMGFTQQALAKATGMSQSALSEIERGDSKSASAENLLKIALVFETNPQWLLNGEGDSEFATHPNDIEIDHLTNSLSTVNKEAWIAVGRTLLKHQKSEN